MENEDYSEFKQAWMDEQVELKKKLILENDFNFSLDDNDSDCIKYIAGVDISFVPDADDEACAALVVLSYPELEVVWEKYEMVKLTLPYISTFLAFREVEHIVKLVDVLRDEAPQYLPQVILVDGNGFLHPRGFGFACHLGVLIDIPTIGVGKTLLFVDGINKKEVIPAFKSSTQKKGDFYELVGESGQLWGVALKPGDDITNPIYISIGHRVDLPTSIDIATRCCNFKIPEPVRQADLRSREFIRSSIKTSNDTVRFVGNISYQSTEEEISEFFSGFSVVKVELLQNNKGRSKGCALVEFSSPEDAENAVEALNGTELDGRIIVVREDKKTEKQPKKKEKKQNQQTQQPKKKTNNSPKESTGTKVFISNIPYQMRWYDLKDLFSTEFDVTYADIMKKNGRPSGCGIVEFATKEQAQTAIEQYHGASIEGREINLREYV